MKTFRLGIANCLNLAECSEARAAVDSAVLDYYASLKPKGYKLVLGAVGSSDADKEAAEAVGWGYTSAPNENLGAKRNAGIAALAKKCDAIVRIGSDDLMSIGLLDEIASRFKIGYEGYLELRGYYMYDVPGARLGLYRMKQFALAFMVDRLQGPLYNDGSHQIDAGLDIRLRSWGKPAYWLNHDDTRPMVALKSGDEMHGFDFFLEREPKMCQMHEDAVAYLKEHFPSLPFLAENNNASTTQLPGDNEG